MADFLNENEINNIVIKKENDNIDVSDFSRINPNISLENLSRYEDIYKNKTNIKEDSYRNQNFKNENVSFNRIESSFVLNREFKKDSDRAKELLKARLKIFMTVYLLVTIILTGFVIFNVVETILIKNKISTNNVKINQMKRVIEKQNEKQQSNFIVEIPEDLNILNNTF